VLSSSVCVVITSRGTLPAARERGATISPHAGPSECQQMHVQASSEPHLMNFSWRAKNLPWSPVPRVCIRFQGVFDCSAKLLFPLLLTAQPQAGNSQAMHVGAGPMLALGG
jgi:hypothetical protein